MAPRHRVETSGASHLQALIIEGARLAQATTGVSAEASGDPLGLDQHAHESWDPP